MLNRSRGRAVYSDPAKAEGKDHNRYYRCRFCGFINDVTKRPPGKDGVGYMVEQITWPAGTTIVNDTPPDIGVTLTRVGDAPWYNPYVPREQTVGSGCAFCGSKNYI